LRLSLNTSSCHLECLVSANRLRVRSRQLCIVMSVWACSRPSTLRRSANTCSNRLSASSGRPVSRHETARLIHRHERVRVLRRGPCRRSAKTLRFQLACSPRRPSLECESARLSIAQACRDARRLAPGAGAPTPALAARVPRLGDRRQSTKSPGCSSISACRGARASALRRSATPVLQLECFVPATGVAYEGCQIVHRDERVRVLGPSALRRSASTCSSS